MIISIRSQMDSRVVLYPLLKACEAFGTVCLISSNRQVERLITDEETGGFRNIRVIVDESGAIDDVYAEQGILPKDYDYIILDNMGAIEYDTLIVPVGEEVTEDFQYEIDILKTNSSVKFFQMGSSSKSAITKNARTDAKAKKESREDDPDYKPEDKFKPEDIEEEYNVKERLYFMPYPSWQDTEILEGSHQFPVVESKTSSAIYEILKDTVHFPKNQFDKIMRAKDRKPKSVELTEVDVMSKPKKQVLFGKRM